MRDPSLDELKKWYAKNGSQFSLPSRITFRHLYFSPDKRGAQARDAAASALAKLPGKATDTIDLTSLGDPFMFQDHFSERTSDQVANVFGIKFAEELFKLTPGAWHGPVESGLGWHLVWVDSITPGRTPEFEEVDISEIKSQWLSAQRAETNANFRGYESALRNRPPAWPTIGRRYDLLAGHPMNEAIRYRAWRCRLS